MLHEQTYEKLMDMRLRGMAAAFSEYMDGKGDHQMSFEDRFGLLVDREWAERQERRMQRRLKNAQLRVRSRLEDIDYRHPRSLDRSVMERLGMCRWVDHHENIILTGPTGVGKTWLACALAEKACREGHTILYRRVPRILLDFHAARADGSYPTLMDRIAKIEVLILDDWGLAPLGNRERRDVLEVLDDRHGVRSTIFTSQLPVKLWHDYVGEPTIADAILDRIVHNAHRLELTGPPLRKLRLEGDEDA